MKPTKSIPLRRDLGTQILIILLIFVSLIIVGVLLFEVSAGRRLEADVRAANLALADAVAGLATAGREARLAAGQRLRRRVEGHFGVSAMAQGFLGLYRRLVAEGAARRC